jgi:hypothetical protein
LPGNCVKTKGWRGPALPLKAELLQEARPAFAMTILHVTLMSRDRRRNMCLIGAVRLRPGQGRAKIAFFVGAPQ